MRKGINILYLDHASKIGGAQVSLLAILRNIDGDKYNAAVVCPQKGTFVDAIQKINIPAERLDFDRIRRTANPIKLFLGFVFFGVYVFRIYRIIRERQIELLHANTLKTAIMAGIVAKFTGVPLIWHVRDFLPLGMFRPILVKVAHLLADSVIVNSAATGEMFQKQGARKSVVVHNAIDSSRLSVKSGGNDLGRELGINPNVQVIGTIGRIHPEKGLEYLIEALTIVRKEIPQIRLLVVGEAHNGDTAYARQIIDLVKRHELTDQVAFLGFRRDITEVLSTIDLLVVPALREPFGLVILEAMAWGKPVVATRAGGIPEIVVDGKTGILVSPRDPGALAASISRLLRDKELALRMGQAGRAHFENSFAMEKMMGKIQDVYENVLPGQGC